MIARADVERTLEVFRYDPTKESPKSARPVAMVCPECGKPYTVQIVSYGRAERPMCRSCRAHTHQKNFGPTPILPPASHLVPGPTHQDRYCPLCKKLGKKTQLPISQDTYCAECERKVADYKKRRSAFQWGHETG